jgi:hypothetical protein
MDLPGFPLTCPGGEKYEKWTLRVRNGDTDFSEKVAGVEALGQHLEEAALDGAGPLDADRSAESVRAFVAAEYGRHFDSIDAIRDNGRELEIDFRAHGYPGLYRKRLSLDGPGGRYDLIKV